MGGKRLHTAIRYGITLMPLDAVAKLENLLWVVVRDEYNPGGEKLQYQYLLNPVMTDMTMLIRW